MTAESLLSLEDALEKMLAAARPVQNVEHVTLAEATGRVLAEAVISDVDVPPRDNAAMDGYALHCADVPAVGTRLPVAQRILAGSVGHPLAPGTAARIFTGAPIPAGADAVVPQESCSVDGDGVMVNHLPQLGEHIRRVGEDTRAGDAVLADGQRLTPPAVGLAASVGQPRLPVFRRLSVGLLSTGSELAQPGQPLPPGAIFNSNRSMLHGLLTQLGCAVEDLGDVPDTLDATRRALRKAAAAHDLVITTGGVSVGDGDHVKSALAAEGRLSLWAVAIKPGKPLAFGRLGNADFVGLPGNPVSAFVTFVMLVRPFILARQGVKIVSPTAYSLPSASLWTKAGPRREFLRGRLTANGQIELFPNQSSAVLTSTVWGGGLVDNPARTSIAVGDPVRFLPFAELL